MLVEVEEDVFQVLQDFGLSPYEIRVYRALVLNGPQTAGEVLKSSGIPQPRVYDVLKKLSERGWWMYLQATGKSTGLLSHRYH
ncbi:TrmB family transcriptional regulator [Thermogymnomonas acidicola]|uniref:TrmB family transcriptional regulator n=1 Tax=Thermogymnomonas acidicola TaxID=399579 RepID=UPI0009463659|nr:helix-turn-helix domain-containing protein [Thermogymnomonas acidicola]